MEKEIEYQGRKLKVINTSLPFSDEQLDEYFNNMDDYYFIIDINKSNLNTNQLINYIYNSDMKCDIDMNEYTDKLKEMLLSYIQTNKLINIRNLSELWCIIVEYKLDNSMLKDERLLKFVKEFINENEELIDELINVLYNLSIFLCRIKTEHKDKDENLETKRYTLIKNNFISLRKSIYFYDIFSKFFETDMKAYNYDNFTDNGFEGYKVHHYFYDEFSPFSVVDLISLEDEDNNEQNN